MTAIERFTLLTQNLSLKIFKFRLLIVIVPPNLLTFTFEISSPLRLALQSLKMTFAQIIEFNLNL